MLIFITQVARALATQLVVARVFRLCGKILIYTVDVVDITACDVAAHRLQNLCTLTATGRGGCRHQHDEGGDRHLVCDPDRLRAHLPPEGGQAGEQKYVRRWIMCRPYARPTETRRDDVL